MEVLCNPGSKLPYWASRLLPLAALLCTTSALLAQPFSAQNVIIDNTSSTDAATSVYAADLDGDGDLDVLSASQFDDKIAWYENDGAQNFSPRVITTQADGALSVYAADVDGDGDLDVLSASVFDDKIAWYENDGAQNFSPRVITTQADGALSVYAADVDGDGDLDVLSASFFDEKIAWYENDGAQNFSPRVITTQADGARSVYAADVDGDGDLDVLSASLFDEKIAWYENDGAQNFSPRVITTQAVGASSVYAADLDGDGDLDVLSASQFDDKIAWYENDGAQNFSPRVITTQADGAVSVYAADVDGDGDVDVLSASFSDDKIAWYENDGAQNFSPRVITTQADGARSVYAADVDGDGDLDVLSASSNDDKIAWYENLRITCSNPPDIITAQPTSLPCANSPVFLSNYVSDATSQATEFRFFAADPASNPSIGTVVASNGVPTSSQVPVTPAQTTTYWAVASVPNGCADTTSFEVKIEAFVVPDNPEVVAGQSVDLNDFEPASGYMFIWQNNNTATGIGTFGYGQVPNFVAQATGGSCTVSNITVYAIGGRCSFLPKQFTVTVKPTAGSSCRAGIAEAVEASTGLLAYPNPFSDHVTLVRDVTERQTFVVLDLQGRTVRNGSLAEGEATHRIELSGLAAGVYTLRVGAQAVRLVKE